MDKPTNTVTDIRECYFDNTIDISVLREEVHNTTLHKYTSSPKKSSS